MNWFSYLIQANLYLVLFYAFYWFILRKETFFNLNRTYLLASALSAALIPLLKVEWFSGAAQPMQQRFISATVVVMDGYASPIEDIWTFGDVLTLVYYCVIFIMTIRLIFKVVKLNKILKDKDQPEAFSFFMKIRINRNLPKQKVIETHELAHVKQFHSADVLLFEVLAIINWFNPVIYLYKNSIKHIHEFIADEVVLKTETDKRDYALLLLSKNFGVATHTLTNNFFNQSLLKRRIEMMNKTKSRKTAILKYGLSAPLFLLAMVLSSAKISESKMINKLSEKVKPNKQLSEILIPDVVSNLALTTTKENKTTTISKNETDLLKPDSVVKPKPNKANSHMINEVSVVGYGNSSNDTTGNKVFTNVEVLPSFPGGIEAFGKFLGKNMKYPEDAKKQNMQGRVFCQFVVEKDGSLSNIKVVRGIGGGCDEEAVRVLALSPKWNPGMHKGEIVRVSYVLPIFFQLKDENKSVSPLPPPIDFSSENRPLIFVDGVECKDEETFKKLNPETIDHINVLKDKSATEKYGEKGKNGVILITSKKK